MSRLERLSKRVSTHKRYKIEKKVKEHRRKLKKEPKKKGNTRTSKITHDLMIYVIVHCT